MNFQCFAKSLLKTVNLHDSSLAFIKNFKDHTQYFQSLNKRLVNIFLHLGWFLSLMPGLEMLRPGEAGKTF